MKLVTAAPVTVVPVRARKSPWIETQNTWVWGDLDQSGLVRARGLKRTVTDGPDSNTVRARKSPWIETHSQPQQIS